MSYRSFEDLEVWQRSCRLSVDVFQSFETCKFPNLKSQIERAALSIPSNVAEGAERGGKKEFAQFLKISKGSSGELRTQLYIARKLSLIDQALFQRLLTESKEISAMLEGLRRSIVKSAPPSTT